MANPEHLEILRKGVKAWNEWREKNPDIKIDLSEAEFYDKNFNSANFEKVDFHGAHFRQTGFIDADLSEANLSNSKINATFLDGAKLRGTNLAMADVRGSLLYRADLWLAHLDNANLSGADLNHSNLELAFLLGTNLSNADLMYTNFTTTFLIDVDFTEAKMGGTKFINVDLRYVKGLNTVKHEGPSTIGIDTIFQSFGNIPEIFLKGAGVPDTMIEYIGRLVKNPIQYYSCFISYSSKDQEFAEQLYNDLQNEGVRCWFAPEGMKIGDKILDRIYKEIDQHDKLLLVLSCNSINSEWVEIEVKSAFEKERKQKRTVLFPIRIDNAVWETTEAWASLIRGDRHIGDFRNWQDPKSYEKALERLLRDLMQEDSMEEKKE